VEGLLLSIRQPQSYCMITSNPVDPRVWSGHTTSRSERPGCSLTGLKDSVQPLLVFHDLDPIPLCGLRGHNKRAVGQTNYTLNVRGHHACI
jgi:hypothetical protein